ncbi:MAG: transposase [Duncaniella sp.]|nr:transposase [Duncaniella sp.]
MDDNFFYDRNAPLLIRCGGCLPHWLQEGKLQFITFRLADSIPAYKVVEIKNEMDEFLNRHPKPWNNEIVRRYYDLFNKIDKYLDQGAGECVLKGPEIRRILEETIEYCDGRDYDVVAYVIMPNHVHMLMAVYAELDKIIARIKKYSALNINKALNRKGKLWMREYHDRIVRSEFHFDHCLNYIIQNPERLPDSFFTLKINC